MSAQTSAYLHLGTLLRPHRYHLIFFAWISAAVIAGTAYSILSGSYHYSVAMSAVKLTDAAAYQHLASNAPSVLVDRGNWINQIFVKRAWFWNTAAVAAIAATLKRTAGTLRGERARTDAANTDIASRIIDSKTLLRWGEATIGWIIFAAWLFGPSLSLRVSIATGAQCIVDGEAVESAVCAAGSNHAARWTGGHDISGHTFILSLGILLILEMLVPYLPYVLPPVSFLRQSIPMSIYAEKDIFRTGSPRERFANMAVFWASLALAGLWGFMLVVTAVFHHVPKEKFTGLLYAFAVWVFMPKEHAL